MYITRDQHAKSNIQLQKNTEASKKLVVCQSKTAVSEGLTHRGADGLVQFVICIAVNACNPLMLGPTCFFQKTSSEKMILTAPPRRCLFQMSEKNEQRVKLRILTAFLKARVHICTQGTDDDVRSEARFLMFSAKVTSCHGHKEAKG